MRPSEMYLNSVTEKILGYTACCKQQVTNLDLIYHIRCKCGNYKNVATIEKEASVSSE